MNQLARYVNHRPWAVGVLFILLALSQTFVVHFSILGGFDLIQFLDLSAFYVIPILLWLRLFSFIRRATRGQMLHRPFSLILVLCAGLIVVPVHKAFSLTIDFGCRYALGLIDHLDADLLAEIYPSFLSSLPENYLIYLLFVGITFIAQTSQKLAKKIEVKSVTGHWWVDAAHVEAIYSDRNYVVLQMTQQEIRCRLTSSAAEELFSNCGVVRIHRSVIINPSTICAVKYMGDQCYQFKTKTGKVYSSSARYKTDVERLIERNSSHPSRNSSHYLEWG